MAMKAAAAAAAKLQCSPWNPQLDWTLLGLLGQGSGKLHAIAAQENRPKKDLDAKMIFLLLLTIRPLQYTTTSATLS